MIQSKPKWIAGIMNGMIGHMMISSPLSLRLSLRQTAGHHAPL
jgi:hypothetical protein